MMYKIIFSFIAFIAVLGFGMSFLGLMLNLIPSPQAFVGMGTFILLAVVASWDL